MKKILMALTSLIFIGGIISAVNAAPPDATYLRLNTTNGPLTGALTGPRYTSTVATGTQPYATTSATLNTNLNADLWDGYHFDGYLNQAVKTTSSPVFLGLTVDTNTLFVDSVNDRLGVNTSSPAYPLDCAGDINTSTVYRIGGATVLRSTTDSVFVGFNAGQNNATGQDNTFLGGSAGVQNTTGKCNTFVGHATGLSNTTADFNTCLGHNAGDANTTGFENTFLGSWAGSSSTTGSWNIFIGSGAGGNSGTITSSIGIGCNTVVTADHQLVVGGSWNPVVITDSYWGSGVTKNFPYAFTFNATGGEGTDNPGADLKIAGGKGTGAANGGKIIFQTAPAGPAGTTLNTLVDRVTITSDGNVAIGASAPTAILDVTGTTGYNQLRVRTAFTPVGTADSNGNTGDIAWDDDYVYVKTSVGWKRSALGTW